MKIQVVKRDGRFEDFNPENITKVTKAAGLNDEQAQAMAAEISEWIKSLNKEKVTTLEIRNKVTEELKKVDQSAYNLYVWYEKSKDKNLDPYDQG